MPNLEQRIALHIHDGFATRDGHSCALHVEEWLIRRIELDVEGVAAKRHQLLAELDVLTLSGYELWEDGDGFLKRWQGGSHGVGVFRYCDIAMALCW
jgi:hypothetical protein